MNLRFGDPGRGPLTNAAFQLCQLVLGSISTASTHQLEERCLKSLSSSFSFSFSFFATLSLALRAAVSSGSGSTSKETGASEEPPAVAPPRHPWSAR